MPKTHPTIALGLVAATLASPAMGMDRYGRPTIGTQSRIADPDERLERLAAAGAPTDRGHGKPPRSARGILRDDPYLRGAFASLDNK